MSIQFPIDVDDQSFEEILRPVGFPVLSIDDFELTREEIEKHCILPAMREYYKWYPNVDEQSYSVSGQYSVDFPDDFVFGATDVRLAYLPRGAGTTKNPFVNERMYSLRQTGSYGTRYDYGLQAARIYERYEKQSLINQNSALRVKVDQKNRRVYGYATITGDLQISWARWDNEFQAIPYQHLTDVIELSQAYVLETLGMIRGQMNNGTDVDYNYDMFISRAQELREKVLTEWRAHTRPVLMRG